jgi:hypothetical protein
MLGDLFLQERKERKRVVSEGVATILNHPYAQHVPETNAFLIEDWLEEIVSEGVVAPNRSVYFVSDGSVITIGKTDDLGSLANSKSKVICLVPGDTTDMETRRVLYSSGAASFTVTVNGVVRNMLALYHMEHDDD